jgi:hypothetical protein
MNYGVEIEIHWCDDDFIEILLRASNHRFVGTIDAYVTQLALDEFANKLRGFPVDSSDCREFELGTFDPKYAGGGVRLRFSCGDSAGHAFVNIELRSNPHCSRMEIGSASFVVPVEAAAIDSFVRQLTGMGAEVGQRAELPMAL